MIWMLISGCCRNAEAPILQDPPPPTLGVGEEWSFPLEDFVVDSHLPTEELLFHVQSSNSSLRATVQGSDLRVSTEDGWEGTGTVSLEVTDRCEQSATVSFEVNAGIGEAEDGECVTEFSHRPVGEATGVQVAGSFNGWTGQDMERQEDGSYSLRIALEDGAYSYKFVELGENGSEGWLCDPDQALFQCDKGQSLATECSPDTESCNSMVTVSGCSTPDLALEELEIDRASGSLTASVLYDGESLASFQVLLDGEDQSVGEWDGESALPLSFTQLAEGRHLLRISATDESGRDSEELHIPFWLDEHDWRKGLLYFVFVDRFSNGDSANDAPFGANWETADYMGGDWAGVADRLDHLESLGVTAIWLTAPQDNAEGAFDGKCGMTITGYHGYWPASGGLESHFGTEEELRELIGAAHDRGMRVLVDWVGNHVHEDHPYAQEHPEWFTDLHLCDEDDNWNQAPETCWFAPYLPTIDYYAAPQLHTMVDDALQFAKDYDIDGYRVDAVKHIPQAVHHNFQARVRSELEHSASGGSFEFYTVGETFSGDSALLSSYIGPDLLDGQFDFSLYWSILSALGRYESPLIDLEDSYTASKETYGDALMSQFLGNHDVERFLSHAAGEVGSLYGDGLCPEDTWRGPAQRPDWFDPYGRLKLAWTWLLTHEGTALIYYGDEIGLPGYHDPDNRQMMRFGSDLSDFEEEVLGHVQKLGQARKEHPELLFGERQIWWGVGETEVLAVSRSSDEGHSIVLLNRSWEDRSLSNGLEWAGLPIEGSYTDVLTGDVFTPAGDGITIGLDAMSSRALVWTP
jgi:neopullulanase